MFKNSCVLRGKYFHTHTHTYTQIKERERNGIYARYETKFQPGFRSYRNLITRSLRLVKLRHSRCGLSRFEVHSPIFSPPINFEIFEIRKNGDGTRSGQRGDNSVSYAREEMEREGTRGREGRARDSWNPTFYTGSRHGIHSAKERTKEHPREYLLDAPINREPVATRCTFLHRWKVWRRDWKIGGEKTSFLARFTLIFTPCLRVQTSSFLFFFPLPPFYLRARRFWRGNFSRWKILSFFLFLSLPFLEIFSRRDSSLGKILRNVNV